MKPALALDLTVLFLGPASATPRGVDRVEIAYARHFLKKWQGDCYAVMPTPWGIRFFERERATRFLLAVEEMWKENVRAEDDAVYLSTRAALLGRTSETRFTKRLRSLSLLQIAGRFLRAIAKTGFSFGRSVRAGLPRNAIYLNVGQLQIEPIFFNWLKKRPDVTGIFMIHDVGPIQYPDLHSKRIVSAHHRIVRNTAQFGDAVIFPSRAARDDSMPELQKYQGRPLAAHVELLPVPDEFLAPDKRDPDLAGSSYFIVCGAIDPHKNHLLLLDVWEKLIERLGGQAPKLVIVGSPQPASAPVFERLESNPLLRRQVIVSSGLSTPALRTLMMGARALLMPSITEGFGLPIVEALALEVPVLASDIPAHREAGEGGEVRFLPLDDTEKWLAVILAMHQTESRAAKVPSYQPRTWQQYFSGLEAFLLRLHSERMP